MIDTHAHLYMCKQDIDTLLSNAKKAGITHIVQVAVDKDSALTCLDLYETYPILFPTIGIHPMYKEKFSDIDALEPLLKQYKGKFVAVGECGLDYKYPHDKKAQAEVFEAQLRLAKQYNKPVIIHQRQAEEDMIPILNAHSEVPTVIHCFASDINFANAVKRDNLFYSFTGLATYTQSHDIHDVIATLPLEKIMIETDCPYLTPLSKKGSENEPTFVKEVAEKIATIKGLSTEAVIQASSNTAKSFFDLA